MNPKKKRRLASTNTSGYTGVRKRGKRFKAQIKIDRKIKSLGTYDTPKEAALAYDRAVVQHKLSSYKLNFPIDYTTSSEDDESIDDDENHDDENDDKILSKNVLDFANRKQLSIANVIKFLSQSIKHIVSATSSNAVLDPSIKEIWDLKKAVEKDHEEIQALKYSNVFDGTEETFDQHVADLREVGQDILAAERNCKARAATVLKIVEQEDKVLKLRELLNKELEELNVWEEFHYVN